MGKTAAERKKQQRERLKASGKFQAFKDNESRKQRERRNKKKNIITDKELNALRAKKKEEMRRYRAKKALKSVVDAQSDSSNTNLNSPRKAFKSPNSFGKALAKIKRNLPKSPKKSQALVKVLASQLIPDVVKLPPQKSGATKLSDEIKSKVEAFYEKESISYQAPGRKDFVIIRERENKKSKVQKRYLCITLGEAYEVFKDENPEIKIGHSKFCECRPVHICLRHETPSNLCLCVYHENIRLLLEAICFLPRRTSDFVKFIVCDENREDCFYQKCEQCRNFKKLHEASEVLSEDDLEEEVKFFQWMKDETKLVTRQAIHSTMKDAIEMLEKKLPQFLEHVYVKCKQEMFFENIKTDMPINTLFLHFDFSENYSFFSQDEIQSAHWVSTSCTLYTAIAYFIVEETCKSLPIVVVSDYLHHDKYAVTVFNNAIISRIRETYPDLDISKIIYRSDGTAQHFKQKYSICIAMLQPGNIEWHFSATGHGKGPIDGVGGAVKRRVREATLARKIDPHSAAEFAEAAEKICTNVMMLYISERSVINEKHKIDEICSPSGKEIAQIPNTRKFHCFIKKGEYVLKAANTSMNPTEFCIVNLITGEAKTENVAIADTEVTYITDYKIGSWVLVPLKGKKSIKHFAGQIINKGKSTTTVKFLQRKGESFVWPIRDDISDIHVDMNIPILPEPNFDRRLNFTFDNFNFSKYVMG